MPPSHHDIIGMSLYVLPSILHFILHFIIHLIHFKHPIHLQSPSFTSFLHAFNIPLLTTPIQRHRNRVARGDADYVSGEQFGR